jgi:predicted phosphoribosyltransferase
MKTPTFRIFRNRVEAGRELATRLARFATADDVVILALPRGGVPVAAEVAKALGKPFDLLLVRKLGLPGWEETAMGAIASGGTVVMNDDLVEQLRVPDAEIDAAIRRETRELERREELYRGGRPPAEVTGKTVLVVDDGIATGATMLAALRLLRRQRAGRIVVATPVAPPDTVERLARDADEVVTLAEPEPFGAVGRWYEDFSQTTDDEVRRLLAEAG